MDLQPDFWGHKERAEEARSILGSQIYGMASDALRATYREELESLEIGSPHVVVVHAKLKVLDEVKGQLQHYVNEYQFREARK
jgi:diphthamide biosynthesis methyltransferase